MAKQINIIVNPVAGGWSPWDTRVGGTEESVIEWATRLVTKGYKIDVFHNGTHGTYGGANYRDRSEYLHRTPGITLNCNYPDLPIQEPTVYFNNLTHAGQLDLSGFQAVIHPSQYALDVLGVEHPEQHVVYHGYDPARIYPGDKIPKQALYASSPDRGLDVLRDVWPQVVEAHPDAQLIVTYGGEIDTPNTICVGSVASDFMDELYRASDVWLHPCLGGELFGITAVKAQAAGCIPIYYPTMALTETVKYGYPVHNPDHMADRIIQLFNDGTDLDRAILSQRKFVDWDESTNQLEHILLQHAS